MGQDLTPPNDTPRANGLQGIRVVSDVVPVFDTGKFEHMQRIAMLMSRSSLVPAHLKGENPDEAAANCFLVVNQANNWGMDPFAVAQATFVTQGKIGYEGKLISAALQKKLGIKLYYTFTGKPGAPDRGIVVSDMEPGKPGARTVEGSVANWATKNRDGKMNHMWLVQSDDQLIYRGTRQWCRRYEPGVILGVFSDDELEDMAGRQMRDVTPQQQVIVPPPPPAKQSPPPAANSTAAAKPEPVQQDQQSTPRVSAPPPPPRKPPGAAAATIIDVESEEIMSDAKGFLAKLRTDMAAAENAAEREKIWEDNQDLIGRLSRADRTTAESIYDGTEKEAAQ
jgi:hypothetical protein